MNGHLDSLVSSLDKISPDNELDMPPSSHPDANHLLAKPAENVNDRNARGLPLRPSANVLVDKNGGLDHLKSTTNHTANVNLNHHPLPSNPFHVNNDKKFKNYKLISDPLIRKGAPKIYRYDGQVSQVSC